MMVLAHGCFDILHIGHIEYLNAAKALGNKLIVTITADRHIRKGFGRPIFNQDQRKQMLEALKIVDQVQVIDDPTALPAIHQFKPDIYVKGMDYSVETPALKLEREAVESYGGKLIIITTPKYSSSTLIDLIAQKTCNPDNAMDPMNYRTLWVKGARLHLVY